MLEYSFWRSNDVVSRFGEKQQSYVVFGIATQSVNIPGFCSFWKVGKPYMSERRDYVRSGNIKQAKRDVAHNRGIRF
ncbi:uncharacterized protein DS421_3g76910 [Arachis hypogaea]|nr:uncharacterized protein DS421_3g76910 [Arachis hypogaea]